MQCCVQRTVLVPGLPTALPCVGLCGDGWVGGLRHPMPGLGVVVRSRVLKVGHSHHSGISNGVRGYLNQVALNHLMSESFSVLSCSL